MSVLERKKVLVTGGAGFVGSHLVEELVKRGAKVTVIALTEKNKDRNLKHVIDRIEFIKCDVADDKEISLLSNRDFDYVFHLAAVASPHICEKNPGLAFRTNVHGTYNVLTLATKMKNLKKIFFASSGQLYGKYPNYTPIDEKHPTDFTESVYNMTKGMGEVMFNSFHKKYGLPILVFRFFSIFGPRQVDDYLIPKVILQALNKGVIELWNEKPTRDYNFVTNVVDALIIGTESDFIGGPINIGYGIELKIGDLSKQIAEKLNAQLKFLNMEVVGPMRLHCNNDLAKNVLKWTPKISFEKGLDKTIEWFKRNNSG